MTKATWELRADQLEAFQALIGKHRGIVNTPTGWGKTFLLCCLSTHRLLQANAKVVLCVPQRIISKGFVRPMKIRLPDGQTILWRVPRNLCDTTPEKVAQLLDFIVRPVEGDLHDRVVLSTHMSLSYAFERLGPEDIGKHFRNTVLVIDEAHHIQASEFGCNQLGRAIATILDLNDPTVMLLFATAYFFRGDHLPILSENHLARFFRFHLPFDQYWASLKHVKTYGYDFVAYKGTVFHEFESLLRQGQQPTIVYCPPEGHKLLLGKSKGKFVARVRHLCENYFRAKTWKVTSKPSAGKKYIVDLVDTKHRAEKIRFIAAHGDAIAAVLTVGMFREGADWVEAARIIDLVPTGSDQDRLQRFGRLVRDCPKKSHISYFSFFPFVVEEDEEERRRELSKLYAHFHASLVLHNAICPIKMKLGTKGIGPNDDGERNGARLDLLGRLDAKTQETIIKECIAGLLQLQDDKRTLGAAVSPEEAKGVVVGVLKQNGVKTDIEATAKQVILVIRRRSNVRMNTEDLVDAGFDKVWSVDVFDGLIVYSGGMGGPTTLSEIRRVIDTVFDQQWMDNFAKVRELSAPPNSQSSAYWWCSHNKVLHDQGKLEGRKIELLRTIPWWSWAQSFEDRWQTTYDAISVLPECPKAGTPQYTWVRQQRRLYDKGRLEEYKIKLLEAISWWAWTTLTKNWDAIFTAVASLPEPPVRGSKQYAWMRTQRKTYRDGKLSADRASRLEAIPWWQWKERASSRDEGLAFLEQCITTGLAENASKAEVKTAWSKKLGIGSDQVHKYLRKLDAKARSDWDNLRDDRGKG